MAPKIGNGKPNKQTLLRCEPHMRLPVVSSLRQHTLKLEYKRSSRSIRVRVWPLAYVFSDQRPDLLLV
eukprot:7230972-Heterocapsa_arctica.AAC.1